MNKRRLYEKTPVEALNEDGTRKTLKQQIHELNEFIKQAISEMENDNEDQ